ncbi:MAG: FecR family protein, partial [Candidatus Limnocylindria bacterium]|nr:FecR family protein [Candidatus Limnocylindria bacterium]
MPIASLVLIPALLFVTQRQSAGASTVLTIFTGIASVARGQSDFTVATDGAILASADRVRTDDAGHALITFFDGSTIELEPSTTVQIDAASSNANGSISIELSQSLGRTWASVQKLAKANSKFEIKTPTATAAVRGTGFLTEVLASGETTVQTT